MRIGIGNIPVLLLNEVARSVEKGCWSKVMGMRVLMAGVRYARSAFVLMGEYPGTRALAKLEPNLFVNVVRDLQGLRLPAGHPAWEALGKSLTTSARESLRHLRTAAAQEVAERAAANALETLHPGSSAPNAIVPFLLGGLFSIGILKTPSAA